MTLPMSTKPQFKMYLPDDVIDDLDKAAITHGKKSGQEVVKELIEFYLPVWKVVNTHTRRSIERQTTAVLHELAQNTAKSERSDDRKMHDGISGRILAPRSQKKMPFGNTPKPKEKKVA